MTKAKILIVEDEIIIARELEARLIGLGYDVLAITATGEEAIQLVEDTQPDLVLMDIVLAGSLDGIQTAEEIHWRFGVPVVYLTAYADESTLQRAKITEPVGYLLKPFTESELRATVGMALHKHQLETKLKQLERWLTATLNSIGDAVLATNIQGQIIFMNPVAETLTEWRPEEALGKDIREVFNPINANTRAPAENLVTRVLREGIVINLAGGTLLITKNRDDLLIDDVATPIRDDQGNITGVVLVFRDISERKRMEETQQKLQEQLFETQKMESLGTLAGGIAHDFNNLLTGIMGFADVLLLKMGPTHELIEYPKRVLTACRRARDLVNQLLTFSRPTVAEKDLCHLGDFFNEFSALLRRTISERIDIEIRPVPEQILLAVNGSQLQQVLLNLAINARDAMPESGRLQIETTLVGMDEADVQGRAHARPGQFARITVSDTGQGIPPQILPRIFEPFFTTKEVGQGTGLGLPVAYGIITAHGGWIDVESEVGRGTSFHVYLRVAEEVAEEMVQAEEEESIGGSETILLVEDELLVLESGRELLEALGYRVLIARDGREAVEVYAAHRDQIDLVMLDVVMPHMSGEKVFEKLRELNPQVRLLFATGYSPSEVIKGLWQQSAASLVQKPYDVKTLARAVRNSLRGEET